MNALAWHSLSGRTIPATVIATLHKAPRAPGAWLPGDTLRPALAPQRPCADGEGAILHTPDVIVVVDAPAIDSGRETCYRKAVGLWRS